MISITATSARKDIFNLIKRVNDDSTPVLITNNNGENAILIGENDWRSIEETLYLNSIPGLADSIIAANDAPDDEFVGIEDLDW